MNITVLLITCGKLQVQVTAVSLLGIIENKESSTLYMMYHGKTCCCNLKPFKFFVSRNWNICDDKKTIFFTVVNWAK